MESSKLPPLHCTIKKPVLIKVGELSSDTQFLSGCSAVDVMFSHPVEIAEICFKNYYTASITVKGRTVDDEMLGSQAWRTYVKNFVLMPHPHCESGSQNYFAVGRKQLAPLSLSGIKVLRLILRQPSPHWEEFGLEEIKCFLPPAIVIEQEWMKTASEKSKDSPSDNGIPNLSNISSQIQELWALAEAVKTSQPAQMLGRFDVDGCYDINLLSYT